MPQSLSMNLIHLIYSTKERRPWLTPEIRPALFAYQAGAFKELGCPAIIVGGESENARESSRCEITGNVTIFEGSQRIVRAVRLPVSPRSSFDQARAPGIL